MARTRGPGPGALPYVGRSSSLGAHRTVPCGVDGGSRAANTCIMTQARKRRPPSTPKQAAACCGPVDELLDPVLFKAISDPTRAALLACIAKCGRGCSVGEVAECCSVDLSVVSRHLALLARCGVLAATREGRTVLYQVRYAELCRALRSLADALEECRPARGGPGNGRCC